MFVVATIKPGALFADVHSVHRVESAAEAALVRHARAMPDNAIIEARVYEVDGRARAGERIGVDMILEAGPADLFDDAWYD